MEKYGKGKRWCPHLLQAAREQYVCWKGPLWLPIFLVLIINGWFCCNHLGIFFWRRNLELNCLERRRSIVDARSNIVQQKCTRTLTAFHSNNIYQSWDNSHPVIEIGAWLRAAPNAQVLLQLWLDDTVGCMFTGGIPPHVTLMHEIRSFHGCFDGWWMSLRTNSLHSLISSRLMGSYIWNLYDAACQPRKSWDKKVEVEVENRNWEVSGRNTQTSLHLPHYHAFVREF